MTAGRAGRGAGLRRVLDAVIVAASLRARAGGAGGAGQAVLSKDDLP